MSGLLMLKEHVDDTEDLINIELDNRCCPVLMTLVTDHGTALSYNALLSREGSLNFVMHC